MKIKESIMISIILVFILNINIFANAPLHTKDVYIGMELFGGEVVDILAKQDEYEIIKISGDYEIDGYFYINIVDETVNFAFNNPIVNRDIYNDRFYHQNITNPSSKDKHNSFYEVKLKDYSEIERIIEINLSDEDIEKFYDESLVVPAKIHTDTLAIGFEEIHIGDFLENVTILELNGKTNFNKDKLFVDGKEIKGKNVSEICSKGYISLSFLAEILNMELGWNHENKEILISNGDKSVTINVSNKVINDNGNKFSYKDEVLIKNGRTYILSSYAESLWNVQMEAITFDDRCGAIFFTNYYGITKQKKIYEKKLITEYAKSKESIGKFMYEYPISTRGYYLYDFNNDGVLELIVEEEHKYTNLKIYTIENGKLKSIFTGTGTMQDIEFYDSGYIYEPTIGSRYSTYHYFLTDKLDLEKLNTISYDYDSGLYYDKDGKAMSHETEKNLKNKYKSGNRINFEEIGIYEIYDYSKKSVNENFLKGLENAYK